MTPLEIRVDLHGVSLDAGSPWARIPPRPVASRQPGYEDRFDRTTLFYDVFRDGEDIELIGPPLLNLAEGLRPLTLRGRGRRYARGLRSTALNRLHRHRLTGVPGDVEHLRLRCALGSFRLEVGADLSDSFAGRRVLVTQSQDNPIPWISRWIDHHVRTQDIDAVLLYDNGSTAYDSDDLRSMLLRRPGLRTVSVVDWPYPWGPTGGPDGIWDSDYGQHGSWEHAWRRLCRTAETITFGDVDELIVGPRPSVTDRALASPQGVCSYARRSVLNIPSVPTRVLGRQRDYADYALRDPSAGLLTPKYTVVPGRLEDTDQLMVHHVRGREVDHEPDVLARHFDGIRIEWRDGEESPVPDQSAEELGVPDPVVDDELVAALTAPPA